MEITPFEIYLVMQLNSLCWLLLILCTVTGGVSVVSFINLLCISTTLRDSFEEERALFKRVLKTSVPLSIVFLLLFVVTPSTKTVAAMYVIPNIVNNENVQKLPDEMLQLFQKSIKDMMPKQRIEDAQIQDNPHQHTL